MSDKIKKDKFSYVCRGANGCGYFQSKKTGNLVEKRIKSEGLSLSALLYFGHAVQDFNGNITMIEY